MARDWAYAYDTETTGLHPYHGADMFSYSTSDTRKNLVVQRLDGKPQRVAKGNKELRRFWDDAHANVIKVAHNLKFDLTFTEKQLGRSIRNHNVHCTHKMSHILQNHHPSHSLDQLGWELAEYPRIDGHMRRLARLCGGYQRVPEPKMNTYQKLDVERGMLLFLFFWEKIRSNKQWLECYNTEIELIKATMDMEARGLMVNVSATRKAIHRLEQQVYQCQEDLFDLVGKRFNPDSSKELSKILFTQLNMPVYSRTKKTKAPSTDKHALMRLREETNHPILNLVLQIRSYSKGITTLQSYIDLSRNDILRPNINTCQAITGRESTTHPNLQNVQKAEVLLNPFPVPAREAFRPRPGYVIIYVDYSGIEMRLLIHYSEDDKMLECLQNGDGDVHSLAARVFYGTRFDEVDSNQRGILRSAAKNANFATPYGAGARKVALTLGLPAADGMAAFKRHKQAFPKLDTLSSTVAEWVREQGYVTTEFGRRLYVPKSKAYVGTNYIIQGTAAGILKRAQIRVHKYNQEQTGGEVKLLLPIHDELVIEYPRARLGDLREYLRDIHGLMVDFPMFKVPFDVDAQIATHSWAQKQKFNFKSLKSHKRKSAKIRRIS